MISTFLCTIHEDVRKWDSHLRNFQWVVNIQVNKTIGCCPNEVVFRFRLRDGDNKLLAALYETDELDVLDDLPSLEEVAKRADEAKSKWKIRFDNRHSTPTEYHEDDLVLIENIPGATGESRKLEPKHRGPYVVKKVLGNDRYLIADLPDIQSNQRPFESVFASDKLKRWCTLGPEVDDDDEPEQNSQTNTEGGIPSGLAELSAPSEKT